MAEVSSLSAALKFRFNASEEVKEDTLGLLPVRGLPLLLLLLANALPRGGEGETRMPMDRPTST